MPDMLVRLYDMPPVADALDAIAEAGYTVRRAQPADTPGLLKWLADLFPTWLPEVRVSLAAQPPTCFIAERKGSPVGFAAYDASCRNFFGPTGVDPACRGDGVGRALLLTALHAQAAQGYAYSIIGGVGPLDYYRELVDAQLIEGSTPGIYVEGWTPGAGGDPGESEP